MEIKMRNGSTFTVSMGYWRLVMLRRLWRWLVRFFRRLRGREEEWSLPDPRAIARVWSKLDPETQHQIQRAYGLCDCAPCEQEKAEAATARVNIMDGGRGTRAFDISEPDV